MIRMLLLLPVFALTGLLPCCLPPPVRHGDFVLYYSWKALKDHPDLQSPEFTTVSAIKGHTFTAVDLPVAIDPLEFSYGGTILPGEYHAYDPKEKTRGMMTIDAFSLPDRRHLGRAIYHENFTSGSPQLRVERDGKRQLVKNFMLKVKVREAFTPNSNFDLFYFMTLKAP